MFLEAIGQLPKVFTFSVVGYITGVILPNVSVCKN